MSLADSLAGGYCCHRECIRWQTSSFFISRRHVEHRHLGTLNIMKSQSYVYHCRSHGPSKSGTGTTDSIIAYKMLSKSMRLAEDLDTKAEMERAAMCTKVTLRFSNVDGRSILSLNMASRAP